MVVKKILGIDVGFEKCAYALISVTHEHDDIAYQLLAVEAIDVSEVKKSKKLNNTDKCLIIVDEFEKRRALMTKADEICVELQIDHLNLKNSHSRANGLMHDIQVALMTLFHTFGYKANQVHLVKGHSKLALRVVETTAVNPPRNMKYEQRKEFVRLAMKAFCDQHKEFDTEGKLDAAFFKRKHNPTVFDQCDAMAHAISYYQRTVYNTDDTKAATKKRVKRKADDTTKTSRKKTKVAVDKTKAADDTSEDTAVKTTTRRRVTAKSKSKKKADTRSTVKGTRKVKSAKKVDTPDTSDASEPIAIGADDSVSDTEARAKAVANLIKDNEKAKEKKTVVKPDSDDSSDSEPPVPAKKTKGTK